MEGLEIENNMGMIYEVAIRNKYRFPYKGMITIEDLWDLNFTALDNIYKSLNAEKKQDSEDSLITPVVANTEIENKIAIVKYVYEVKKAEADARKLASENRKKKERIMEIIANRQDVALQNMSDDELKAMLESM